MSGTGGRNFNLINGKSFYCLQGCDLSYGELPPISRFILSLQEVQILVGSASSFSHGNPLLNPFNAWVWLYIDPSLHFLPDVLEAKMPLTLLHMFLSCYPSELSRRRRV